MVLDILEGLWNSVPRTSWVVCCVAGRGDDWTGWTPKFETLPEVMAAIRRSGDVEPLLDVGVVLGGDLGDWTVTEGPSCGVERKSKEVGRLCPFLGGETDQ
jgi:hypothetical protein